MDRERQEPTFGASDLENINFRPRNHRGQHRQSDELEPWTKAIIGLIVLVLVAMGLIEWNARRQAAAMTAELTRPMTPKEEAQFKAQIKRREQDMQAETAKELAEVKRQLWMEQTEQPAYTPSPLKPGQRCMQGRRLERIKNGWQQLREPC